MDKEGNISAIEQYIIDYVFKLRKEKNLIKQI